MNDKPLQQQQQETTKNPHTTGTARQYNNTTGNTTRDKITDRTTESRTAKTRQSNPINRLTCGVLVTARQRYRTVQPAHLKRLNSQANRPTKQSTNQASNQLQNSQTNKTSTRGEAGAQVPGAGVP